jgi:hypothetical protein
MQEERAALEREAAAADAARAAARTAATASLQVRLCSDRFPLTGDLGYRGAVGIGYRFTV